MLRFMSIIAIVSGVLLSYCIYKINEVPDTPALDLQKWWGAGHKPNVEDVSVRPFKISLNDTVIKDLKIRIKNRRQLTKSLEGTQSEYGLNIDYLEKVLNYWHDKYDFKKRLELLNQFPHYKTRIQGLDIHFIRVKPQERVGLKVLPILLLHGWPSSSKEFYKVIPMLTTQREGYNFVFEVVSADLPGFGFSEGTNKIGLNSVQIGIIMKNLMQRLGFEKFYVQAGDWGSQSATHMATMFPENVLGFHTNMPISSKPISMYKLLLASLYPSLFMDFKHVERIYPLRSFFEYLMREGGYFHLQSTKPDTIGVALTDSPAGLAAYIIEKMGVCSNRDQINTPHSGIENLDLDDVLDTIMVTWINNCIVTSMRIYAESMSTRWNETYILHRTPTPVPTAALNFRYEVIYQPDWLLRDKFHNLVRSTTFDFGGHFAGLQTPQELADDVFESAVEFLKFHETKRYFKNLL